MADEYDRAGELVERWNSGCVELARVRSAEREAEQCFGDCADCGDPIPEARRRALPNASRCIGCQRDFERRS